MIYKIEFPGSKESDKFGGDLVEFAFDVSISGQEEPERPDCPASGYDVECNGLTIIVLGDEKNTETVIPLDRGRRIFDALYDSELYENIVDQAKREAEKYHLPITNM